MENLISVCIEPSGFGGCRVYKEMTQQQYSDIKLEGQKQAEGLADNPIVGIIIFISLVCMTYFIIRYQPIGFKIKK